MFKILENDALHWRIVFQFLEIRAWHSGGSFHTPENPVSHSGKSWFTLWRIMFYTLENSAWHWRVSRCGESCFTLWRIIVHTLENRVSNSGESWFTLGKIMFHTLENHVIHSGKSCFKIVKLWYSVFTFICLLLLSMSAYVRGLFFRLIAHLITPPCNIYASL